MPFDWVKQYPKECNAKIDIENQVDLPSVLMNACEKFSGNGAITCMGSTISYRQYLRQSKNFANFLKNDLGLEKGDRIAIMLPNIIQFPIAFLGAQLAGIICVNTNPQYTPREMAHQFADSGAKAIIILDLFSDKLEKILGETKIETIIMATISDQLPIWKGAIVTTLLKVKGQVPKTNLDSISFETALKKGRASKFEKVVSTKDDVALLQYTGGTTGPSKGAELTHGNILANMAQISNATSGHILSGKETVLTALPLYHIFALVVNFLSFIKMGQRLILVPKPIPIGNTVKAIKKYRPGVLTGVNTLFNALNQDDEFKNLAPDNIKIALAGGMALQEVVADDWKRITGSKIIEGFGLTEASPVTHVTPLTLTSAPKGTIGLPVASTEAKIVDDNGKEVAHGEVGELLISGPQVMKGYWNNPEETKNTIKNGWLYTGDIAKRDENGWFFIVDRKKDMIIVSGFNVYPNEIEEIVSSHSKVLECAAIGFKDDKSGEAVKIFIVKKDDSLTEKEIFKLCEQDLTGYKRPKAIEFRDELPKSTVGKILRKDLR